ncbi:mucin-5AC-like isoform X2 [Tigriopus californicus]|uniref:mucin-5AC-like isoform X2 n=1 Tax=Tigriopus californicus TaxID=6832 RepID=UPI0027DA6F51|nr:mucin-5AC-like isoform X2 [Tigriopus californicus]
MDKGSSSIRYDNITSNTAPQVAIPPTTTGTTTATATAAATAAVVIPVCSIIATNTTSSISISAAPAVAGITVDQSNAPPTGRPSSASAAAHTTAATTSAPVTTTTVAIPSHHPASSSSTSTSMPASSTTSLVTSSSSGTSTSNKNISFRPAVFDKLEQLVKDMQDDRHGVPVRSQKLFLTSIPAAFMGYDLIEWLMDRLSIEDSLEAVHLANLLCQFGYYFPVNELKNLIVKDDSSLYRFQTPYYWPSQHHTPDNIEYAIYLAKRSQRNKQKHGLEDYEVEAYNNLKKILASKWDFVTMQAEEQVKINKDRKKGEKIVTDSQEKAYWRVYRPPPGFTTVVESSPVPTREQRIKARSRTREHLTEELEFLRNYCATSRTKVSVVVESLIDHTDVFCEFDAILNGVGPSNPWITDDQTYWMLNMPFAECPTEKRVRKWSISLEDLAIDSLGIQELMCFMKREYSHENLRFWLSVQELRCGPGSEAKIKKKVKEIWDEFLAPGAKAEINIDSKTMEATRQSMKTPSRYVYEEAAEHVYTLLLKKDCYPRFVRSDHYKALMANSINPGNQKKRFTFTFNVKKKPSIQPPGVQSGTTLTQTGTSSNPKMTFEDCNIFGADGSEDPTLQHQHTSSSNPNLTCNRVPSHEADDSVCPWEIANEPPPTTSGQSSQDGTGDENRSSTLPRQSNISPRGGRLSSTSDNNASAGTSPNPHSSSLTHQRSASPQSQHSHSHRTRELTRESSRSSRSGRGTSGGVDTTSTTSSHHHRHHEHYHHHEHHHASKRAKSKSKRKKSRGSMRPQGAGSSGVSTASTACGPDKENLGLSTTAEMLAAGTAALMSTAAGEDLAKQQPSEILLGSIAMGTAVATATALVTSDTELTGTSTMTTNVSNAIISSRNSPLITSVSVDLSSAPSLTSSKCTQTKLDERGVPLPVVTGPTGASTLLPTLPSPKLVERMEVEPDGNTNAPVISSEGGHSPGRLRSSGPTARPHGPVSSLSLDMPPSDSGQALSSEGMTSKKVGDGNGATTGGATAGGTSWTTSTEVCPWEDEANQKKESHPPFVKTYATLGYL